MKNLLLTILLFISFFNLSAQTAQNISFTDTDGVTHDIYSYLDSGYTVILNIGTQTSTFCRNWSENVGNDLWESYGPDGENILRMFFFDVDLPASDTIPAALTVSDEELEAYAQEWGMAYPLINLPGSNTFPEYPEPEYPCVYIICPDSSFTEIGSYGYPYSEMGAHIYLQQCQGFSLDSNATLFDVTQPSPQTLCDIRPLQFEPSMSIFESNTTLYDSTLSFNPFSIKVFINGEYINSESFSPESYGVFYHTVSFEPFNVNFNDTITFVCDYPGDNFAGDDTVTVVIPEAVSTPSSTDSSLTLEASSSWVQFTLFNSQGQELLSNQDAQSFELNPDSCYSIKISNTHNDNATLKDGNDHVIIDIEAGQFDDYTPKLYFHVSNNTVGIHEAIVGQRPIDRYFVDILGKVYRNTDIKSLSKGVYFEVVRYENGHVTSKKLYNK